MKNKYLGTFPRVRFAPSPSGDLHLGSARIALANARLAGHFTLRLDDTNSLHGADARRIVKDLNWLGIYPDRIVRSSELADAKRDALDKLEKDGLVRFDPDGAAWMPIAPGVVLGSKLQNDCVSWRDLGLGKRVTVPISSLGDRLYLTRTDGSYLYHFASVVDDIALGIDVVIRGADHVTNTAKHLLLYDALRTSPPDFAHLPLLLNPDGGKLSKTDGGWWSITSLRHLGFLPEVVAGYLDDFGTDTDAHVDFDRLRDLNKSAIASLDARTLAAIAGFSGNSLAIEIAACGGGRFATVQDYRSYVSRVLDWRHLVAAVGAYKDPTASDVPLPDRRFALTGQLSGPDFGALLTAFRRSGALGNFPLFPLT